MSDSAENTRAMNGISSDEQRAYRIDTYRQAADGIFQPLIDSVLMIVAIRYFAVGDVWKGLISASGFIGFILTAPLTGLLNRTGIPRSRVLLMLTALAAMAMTAGTVSGSGVVFAVSVAIALAAVHLRQPFFTDLYGELYPPDRRAKLISPGLRLKLALSVGMGFLYGRLLDIRLENWRWITGFSIIVFLSAVVLLGRL
ncbi:MAG: hypothetical protein KAJ98_02850, partial [Spirochaetaceae bacterium]|nr:hypothetical protein [Spirochaetaceae bacterium]